MGHSHILLGKICCRTSKKMQERVYAIGYYKKVVISCSIPTALFFISRGIGKWNHCESMILPFGPNQVSLPCFREYFFYFSFPLFFSTTSSCLLLPAKQEERERGGCRAPVAGGRRRQRLNMFLCASHPRKAVASRGSLGRGQNDKWKTSASAGKGAGTVVAW